MQELELKSDGTIIAIIRVRDIAAVQTQVNIV